MQRRMIEKSPVERNSKPKSNHFCSTMEGTQPIASIAHAMAAQAEIDAAETRKVWSKWYHRFAMLFSLCISVSLFGVAGYGLFTASGNQLGLGSGFVFFQVVFALIGLVWAVLLFVAEFSGWRWFTINFGCLKSRFGKSINYIIIGLLYIVFGTFSTATRPMLGVGIVLVLIGAMHGATYCPCIVNEVEENDLTLSYDEMRRMHEAQMLANA